jgi:septum formation protein
MTSKRPIILASSSPRRQYLMKEAGFEFVVKKPDVEEDFPSSMNVEEVAMFLAKKKADFFRDAINNEVVVTADTVVILGNKILNKPANRDEAIQMLSQLSGHTHKVITGVCILSKDKEEVFQDETLVTFKTLSQEEIEFYVDNYSPYDKAGAYGAQDWIGMVAVVKIEGSYFNVMGLPIHKVHERVSKW